LLQLLTCVGCEKFAAINQSVNNNGAVPIFSYLLPGVCLENLRTDRVTDWSQGDGELDINVILF